MKKNIAILSLVFFLVIPVVSQDKDFSESHTIKKIIDDSEQMMFTQGSKVRARILLLTSYITDDKGEIMQMFDLSEAERIFYHIEYLALLNTDVRFHFIWTGPEFHQYTTDWYSTETNVYSTVSVDTCTGWKNGVYTLTIIAEQKLLGSGAECVSTNRYRLY